jgi:hypothetical protein
MKRKILTFSDSNMPGYSWRWDFSLEDEAGSSYKLSRKQIIYGIEDNEALTIEPVSSLRRDAKVYDALASMVSEAGYSLHESELPEIAAKIARFNATLGNQFKRGTKIYGPPYSKAEEADFYRRQGGGPVTVYHSTDARKGQKSRAAKKCAAVAAHSADQRGDARVRARAFGRAL